MVSLLKWSTFNVLLFHIRTCFDPVVANILCACSCPERLIWICIFIIGLVNLPVSCPEAGFFQVCLFNRACLYQTHSNRIMFCSFSCHPEFCIFLVIKDRFYFQFRIQFRFPVASWPLSFSLSFKTELSLSDVCESELVSSSLLQVIFKPAVYSKELIHNYSANLQSFKEPVSAIFR